MRLLVGGLIVLLCGVSVVAQVGIPVRIEVRSDEGPVAGAAVTVAGRAAATDASGTATLVLPPGPAQVTVVKDGFLPATVDLTVGDQELRVIVELTAPPEVDEEVVVVATTRTGRRLDDQPTRVEVLGREEIEEKMLMTPGDIVMMLNEMGGLRVQATSPSLGAASVRVQGMKGRYTRFLSDGLPLFGQQVGGLGLLQIPPMDLGQVEVIKGAASALYGAGAMGGVVNLLSRRPGPAPRPTTCSSTRPRWARTDAVVLPRLAARRRGWSASLLGGRPLARRATIATTTAGPTSPATARGVVRPRLFWDGGNGRSAFLTAGRHRREPRGRHDAGAVLAGHRRCRTPRRSTRGASTSAAPRRRCWRALRADGARRGGLAAARPSLSARCASATGTTRCLPKWRCAAPPAATPGWPAPPTSATTSTRSDVPQFAYTFDVPGVFAQDDVDLASWLSVSAGARVDVHDEYGTFFSPRVAALFRARRVDQPRVGRAGLLRVRRR